MPSEVDHYIQQCLEDTTPEVCLAKLNLLIMRLEALPDDAPGVCRVNLAHQIANMATLLAQREFERFSKTADSVKLDQ